MLEDRPQSARWVANPCTSAKLTNASTGEVLTTGNTRVYPGGESFLGQPKIIAVGDIVMAFNYYYQLSGDTSVKSTADKVLAYYSK